MNTVTCAYCGTDFQDSLDACPSCGMAHAAPVRALPAGTELQGGKFAIGRMLGEGGFGITYKGAHKPLQRAVAIKELFPDGAVRVGTRVLVSADRQDEFRQERENILQEARLIASLNSPYIVAVHDVFQENGTVYIVMEYLEGQTLQAEIDRLGQLAPDRVQEIALDTCEALAVLHSGNLLHRDVKPANIMLAADGRTVLIDFGSARKYVIHQTAQHTRILTEDYAAPEQYSDEARFGPNTDIFCLGATLFHALTGAPPARALDRLLSANPTVNFPSGSPGPLCDAIQQALQLKVQDRPQDIGTFQNALLGSSSPPPAAPRASPTSQPVTFPSVSSGSMQKETKSAGRLSPRGLLLATFSVVLLSAVSATAASGVVPFRSIASALVQTSRLPTFTPTPVAPKPIPTATPQSQSVVPTAVPVAKPGSAPVVIYTAYVRSGPGAHYSILTTISRDARIRVIAKNGSWLYLQIGNSYGWVRAAKIGNAPPNLPFRNQPALFPSATTPTSTPVPRSHANRLSNLRSGPSIQYDIVGGLVEGEQVEPVARNQAGDWLYLARGVWVAAFLIDGVPSPATLPIQEAPPLPTPTLPPPTPTLPPLTPTPSSAGTHVRRPPSPPFSEATAELGRLLKLAVRRNDIETVRRMLQEGVHPDTLEDSWSQTPLSYLLDIYSSNEYEMAILLLEFGADPNAETFGGTLVHNMTKRAGWGSEHDTQMLQTLLQYGGDPCRRNNSGDRPLDLVLSLSNVRRLEPILFPNGEQCP